MYPETTPTTIRYIWNSHQYTEELATAFDSMCGCSFSKGCSYPICVRYWIFDAQNDSNWLFYLEMCEIYFNSIEAYLVEHYPLIAMEAFLLQDITDG